MADSLGRRALPAGRLAVLGATMDLPHGLLMDRRTFLKSAAAVTLLPSLQSPPRPRKAVLISMLPKEGSYAQRFAIAREAGFDAIEMQTVARQDEAAEIRDAAGNAGLRIHSVM